MDAHYLYYEVMSIFRAHIIKVSALLLFGLGTFLYLFPEHGRMQTGESVSSWLSELRVNKDNSEVYEKISSLRTEDGDIPGLLRKASFIVSEHADEFALPVDSTDTSDDDIYNTLLLKWSMHQQEAMDRTVTINDRQNKAPVANENENKSTWNQIVQSVDFVVGAYSRVQEVWDYVRIMLRPLSSGVAIGAP